MVAYGGRGLRPCERKWPITQLECLALLTAIKENHVYLAGQPFDVYTDHISLKYLGSLKVTINNRLARWSLALQPYAFTVHYKEGKTLTTADGLSCPGYPDPSSSSLDQDDDLAEDCYIAQIDADIFDSVSENAAKIRKADSDRRGYSVINFIYDASDGPTDATDKSPDADSPTDSTDKDSTTTTVDIAASYDIARLQRQCPDYKHIIAYLTDGSLPDDEKLAKRVILEAEHYVFINDTLYHLYQPRSKGLDRIMPVVEQLCIPRSL